eukprot:3968414-Pyramimonas_sp.AAC.1
MDTREDQRYDCSDIKIRPQQKQPTTNDNNEHQTSTVRATESAFTRALRAGVRPLGPLTLTLATGRLRPGARRQRAAGVRDHADAPHVTLEVVLPLEDLGRH